MVASLDYDLPVLFNVERLGWLQFVLLERN